MLKLFHLLYQMLARHFGWADYVVLAVVLVMCVILGVIPACTGGKQSTPAEYLVGRLSIIFSVSICS